MKQAADLFDPEPEQWGLRGDPWVWRALRDHLGEAYLPPSVAIWIDTSTGIGIDVPNFRVHDCLTTDAAAAAGWPDDDFMGPSTADRLLWSIRLHRSPVAW